MRRMRGNADSLPRLIRKANAAGFAVTAPVIAKPPVVSTSETGKRWWAATTKRQRALAGSLAVIASSAFIAAANLETAPFTGRKQLIFNIYKPVAESSHKGLVPKPLEPAHSFADSDPEATLHTTGLQLMSACSAAISKAISELAASDPSLQRHLSFIPDTLDLSHSLDLQPDVSSLSRSNNGGDAPGPLGLWKVEDVLLHMTAGQLLQCHSPSDIISAMSRELAPHISNHEAEEHSCSLLLKYLVIGCATSALAAGAVGTVAWAAVAAGAFAFDRGLLVPWLKRQQTYDADAIAAAISTAAGCHPNDVLSAIQRAHVAAAEAVEESEMQQNVNAVIQEELQALQLLLPKSVLPPGVIDSRDLQLLHTAAAREVRSASVEIKAEYETRLKHLGVLVAQKLSALKSPWQGLFGAEPHLLDREAHVKRVLDENTFFAVGNSTGSVKTSQGRAFEGMHRDIRHLLVLYQTSQDWPVVAAMQVGNLHKSHRQLQMLEFIRTKSADEVADQVQTHKDRAYDLLAYTRALRMELLKK